MRDEKSRRSAWPRLRSFSAVAIDETFTKHRSNIEHDQGLRQIFCSLFNKDIKIIEIFMSLNERENVVCFVDFYKINRYRCALIKYL